MKNDKSAEELVNKLPKRDRASLRERFLEIPSIIVSGKTGRLDGTKPPFRPLFDECKWRRDSFVHCEPGAQRNKWGQVKEKFLYGVDSYIVEQAVDLTLEAIRVAWKLVNRKEKPMWLPEKDKEGRFQGIDVQLVRGETRPRTRKKQ